jgi:hypothetical protein
MSINNNNKLLIASLVSKELFRAGNLAVELSLGASNARYVSARAGMSARGFVPLTEGIDRLSTTTVNISKNINELALKVSISVLEVRSIKKTQEKLLLAIDASEALSQDKYIQDLLLALEVRFAAVNRKYKSHARKLSSSIIELDNELRTASVITALARVEATRADVEYQDSLNKVADTMKNTTDRIKYHIKKSKGIMIYL